VGVCEGERGARLHGERPFVLQTDERIAADSPQAPVLLEIAEPGREGVSGAGSSRPPATADDLVVQLVAVPGNGGVLVQDSQDRGLERRRGQAEKVGRGGVPLAFSDQGFKLIEGLKLGFRPLQHLSAGLTLPLDLLPHLRQRIRLVASKALNQMNERGRKLSCIGCGHARESTWSTRPTSGVTPSGMSAGVSFVPARSRRLPCSLAALLGRHARCASLATFQTTATAERDRGGVLAFVRVRLCGLPGSEVDHQLPQLVYVRRTFARPLRHESSVALATVVCDAAYGSLQGNWPTAHFPDMASHATASMTR